MQKIFFITTGGTIASSKSNDGSVVANIDGQTLTENLESYYPIEIIEALQVGSYNLSFDHLQKIAEDVITHIRRSDVKGIIITHGTDTMSDTAYFLSLLTKGINKPILLTGAQMDATQEYGDRLYNMQCAVDVIHENKSTWELGPCIVFSGKIYQAEDVIKMDTLNVNAFSSSESGPVGRIDKGKLTLFKNYATLGDLKNRISGDIVVVKMVLGLGPERFTAMTSEADGVIIEAFGLGNVNHSLLQSISNLIQDNIPVIITSKCQTGYVLPYYGNGGGKDLHSLGAWMGNRLDSDKARILLATLLGNNIPYDDMKQIIETY